MIVEKQKAKADLLLRRKRAIIISLILLALLIAVCVVIAPYMNTATITDADGVSYKIKYKRGVFSLYDANDVEITRESEYNYYVTANGTLINLDNATGEYKIIAVPDTESGEAIDGMQNSILIFPTIEKKNIFSIEVHNDNGEFTFIRYDLAGNKPDAASDFILLEAPLVSYDQTLFAEFYVSAGYPLTSLKINDPIKDEEGEFSEYGLVSEMRTDEKGNEYLYTPAYYIITDVYGNSHKLIIGDPLVSGGGYYVQYVALEGDTEIKRDAVYVYSTAMAEPLLGAAKELVSPMIVENFTLNNYFNVQNFDIMRYDDEGNMENVVGFTFTDLSKRELTVYASKPYMFDNDALKEYSPNDDVIFGALMRLYDTEFIGIAALAPTDEDFIKYGLAKSVTDEKGSTSVEFNPKYLISFEADVYSTGTPLIQRLLISERNETGNYYVFTAIYDKATGGHLYNSDMIVEVAGHSLDFIEYKPSKWTTSNYFDTNIAFCGTLKIETPDYSATFELDNSASDMSEKINSSLIKVSASDSKGNEIDAFSALTFTDTSGYVYTVTPTSISIVNSAGESIALSSTYYGTNTLGRNVQAISGYVSTVDGRRIRVGVDEISIEAPDGSTATFERYATQLFRLYYQTLLAATVVDSYELSAEEEAALVANEANKLLTITLVRTKNAYGDDGIRRDFPEDYTVTYEFYRLTSRKAYIMINGVGGFYVNIDRLNKIVSDAEKFFALTPINALTKD